MVPTDVSEGSVRFSDAVMGVSNVSNLRTNPSLTLCTETEQAFVRLRRPHSMLIEPGHTQSLGYTQGRAPTWSLVKASSVLQWAMLIVATLSLALPPLAHNLIPSQGIVFVAAIYVGAIIVFFIDVVYNFRHAHFAKAHTPNFPQNLTYCILDVLTMASMALEVVVLLHPMLVSPILVGIITKVAMALKIPAFYRRLALLFQTVGTKCLKPVADVEHGISKTLVLSFGLVLTMNVVMEMAWWLHQQSTTYMPEPRKGFSQELVGNRSVCLRINWDLAHFSNNSMPSVDDQTKQTRRANRKPTPVQVEMATGFSGNEVDCVQVGNAAICADGEAHRPAVTVCTYVHVVDDWSGLLVSLGQMGVMALAVHYTTKSLLKAKSTDFDTLHTVSNLQLNRSTCSPTSFCQPPDNPTGMDPIGEVPLNSIRVDHQNVQPGRSPASMLRIPTSGRTRGRSWSGPSHTSFCQSRDNPTGMDPIGEVPSNPIGVDHLQVPPGRSRWGGEWSMQPHVGPDSPRSGQDTHMLDEEEDSQALADPMALVGMIPRIRKKEQHAKSFFLKGLSHELRTPVSVIFSNSEMLLDSNLTEQQGIMVNEVYTSALKALDHTGRILDYLNIHETGIAVDNTVFCFRTSLFEIIQPLQAKHTHLNITVKLDPAIPTMVNGDFGKTRNVLHQIFKNSLDPKHEVKNIQLVVRSPNRREMRQWGFLHQSNAQGIVWNMDDIANHIEKYFSNSYPAMEEDHGSRGTPVASHSSEQNRNVAYNALSAVGASSKRAPNR